MHLALFRYVRNHYSIELPVTVRVGRRVIIAHQGGIVVNGAAVIEDDCVLRQNVTLGAVSIHSVLDAPILCKGVQVGCGAVVIGRVRIGEGARIGPNAVVSTDLPAGATVYVEPPRVLLNMTIGAAQLLDEYGLDGADVPATGGRLRASEVRAYIETRGLASKHNLTRL